MRRLKWVAVGVLTLPVIAAGSGFVYQQAATRRDLAATPPPGRLVDIGGHRLHIWCTGAGSPTVMLESGLGGSSFGWAAVQPRIAKVTRVCSYDRAGYGYSDAGPFPRTSGRIADELAALLDAAAIDGPVVLTAASLGGLSARVLASRQPRYVAGLVLLDTSHEDQQRRLAAVGVEPRLPPGLGVIVRASSFGVLRIRGETLGLDPHAADLSVQPYVRATMHRASRYQAAYSELMSWEESAAEVKASRRTLDIPLVVITAGSPSADDPEARIHSELQRDQATLSRRACQEIAAHAGHDLVATAPGLVVRAVRATLDAVNQGSGIPVCQ
jgi:pimeloyl-ACP methyl ester carboxylesterase